MNAKMIQLLATGLILSPPDMNRRYPEPRRRVEPAPRPGMQSFLIDGMEIFALNERKANRA